ncbi:MULTISPECIES: phosphoribosylglycinamide formyltransferase [unclassified Guyparkeria]|uniref:phosphoribosylglycinamide formyltransferase n=1 Tax=unclassified Guyparkeria TaxID=2626246 RepID=UPI000733805A|nr:MULTISPECIES: phosphoribosylglycinamide formyltransferase [unclassified Guyparkeria]KTG17634.1 phosphoribosylglycinamide formyltransferase [Guyparkeria sp. XI15]OAE88447.1 phosphoribosylglycinamide formyltransferase [Guyparkeria sp. WRN-7]
MAAAGKAREKARLAVLASGNGSNFQAIIDACESGRLDAEIVLLVVNRPGAYALERAADHGIPTRLIDHKAYADRDSFDAALAEALDEARPDWIIMAGFMRILTDAFVERFLGRLINIHPSLLPKYPGLDTHARALEAGDRQHGATVHFVTPTVDDGPPIVQGRLEIFDNDDVAALKQRIHGIEHRIYPLAIDWLVKGQIDFDRAAAQTSPAVVDASGALIVPPSP